MGGGGGLIHSVLAKNSDIAKGQCVVALRLTYLKAHGEAKAEAEAESVFVELNLAQFYALYGELQKVGGLMDFM